MSRADLVLFGSFLAAIWLLCAGFVGIFHGHGWLQVGASAVDWVALVLAARRTELDFRDGTSRDVSRAETVVWLVAIAAVIGVGMVGLLVEASR